MNPQSNFLKYIDPTKNNIWRYSSLFKEKISPQFQITLEEGGTKILTLSPSISGLEKLYFKREDLNPNGSHKDRASAYQISHYLERGYKEVLVSSSGNAALSLSAYGAKGKMKVLVFLKKETHPLKLASMANFSPRIIFTKKPINLAKYVSRRYKIPNLRPSLDDTALEGYRSLAFEIFEAKKQVDSIFIFSTSGSSLVGMGEGFRWLKEKKMISKIPSLHAVQSGNITSISSLFQDSPTISYGKNAPGSLGVKNTARKEAVRQLIIDSNGFAWWISKEEIHQASKQLASWGINTSLEGAACLSAVQKALSKKMVKRPLVILTGHVSGTPSDLLLKPSGENFDSYNELRLQFDLEQSF